VAALAGVSVATASKALNGRDNVHPATRKKVMEAATRISFTPNTLAQGLLAGQSGTVGLLTNDLVGRFSIPILTGAEDAFGTGKMSVLLSDARGDSIRESYHLQALLGRRVDGLIVVGNNTDPRPSLGHDLPVPVVYAYGPSDDPRDHSIVPDNIGAAAILTKHLLDTGRTRIAHITGEVGYLAARDRVQGVVETLATAGLELLGGEAVYGAWSEMWGRAATAAIVSRFPDVDAIICGSDQIARGSLDTLRELGISVPQKVAVAGFDNWEVLATGSRPQLTTVDMDLELLGRAAAQRLFAAIDGAEQSGIETMPCRLVVRGSTIQDA
jgi:LacI family transcriptional regulator